MNYRTVNAISMKCGWLELFANCCRAWFSGVCLGTVQHTDHDSGWSLYRLMLGCTFLRPAKSKWQPGPRSRPRPHCEDSALRSCCLRSRPFLLQPPNTTRPGRQQGALMSRSGCPPRGNTDCIVAPFNPAPRLMGLAWDASH